MAEENNRQEIPKPQTTEQPSGIVKGSVPTMRNPPPPPPKKND
ncbi:hypothetical protein [uncultured Aquimarina sp.]|nr:hypothetical protein [uncultured Aquimarina sp.]